MTQYLNMGVAVALMLCCVACGTVRPDDLAVTETLGPSPSPPGASVVPLTSTEALSATPLATSEPYWHRFGVMGLFGDRSAYREEYRYPRAYVCLDGTQGVVEDVAGISPSGERVADYIYTAEGEVVGFSIHRFLDEEEAVRIDREPGWGSGILSWPDENTIVIWLDHEQYLPGQLALWVNLQPGERTLIESLFEADDIKYASYSPDMSRAIYVLEDSLVWYDHLAQRAMWIHPYDYYAHPVVARIPPMYWDPTSTRYVFHEEVAPWSEELFLMDASGEARQLTDLATNGLTGYIWITEWSPDGSHIAFWWADNSGEVTTQLIVADVQTGSVTPLGIFVHSAGAHMKWSPDSALLAASEGEDLGHTNLAIIDVATGEVIERIEDVGVSEIRGWVVCDP